VACKRKSELPFSAVYKNPNLMPTVAYSQVLVHNPTGIDLFTQDWHVKFVPADKFDRVLNRLSDAREKLPEPARKGNIFSSGYLTDMIKHLKIGFTWIGLCQNIGVLASLYLVRFWGQWTDRFGNKPILSLCTAAKIFFPLMWLFARPGHPLYLCFVYLLFAFNSGQKLALLNIVLKLSPEENRAAYLSSRKAFMSLAQALSPILGGSLAATFMMWKVELPLLTIQGLPFLFLASGLMRFGAFLMLRGLHEPGAQPVRSMVRVLRQIDGFVPTDGLGSFIYFWSAPVRELSQAVWNGGKRLRQAIGTDANKNKKDHGGDTETEDRRDR